MARAPRALLAIVLALALPGCTLLGAEPEATGALATDDTGAASPTPAPARPTPTAPTPASPTPARPTPTSPTPAPTPPANSSAPAGNETAEGNVTSAGNATAPGPVGLVVFNGTFDFSTGEAFLPMMASDTFDVPAGYEQLIVNVTFVAKGAAQPTDRDCTVELVLPGGVVPITSVGGSGGTRGSMSVVALEGEWTLRYGGQGPVEALIEARLF